MKTIRIFTNVLIMLIAGTFVSCVEENLYESGAPDLENCYGVYFPSQENLTDNEFEPIKEGSDATYTKTFTVKRLKSEGAITVPVTVTGDKFTATEIKFADGEYETSFDVTLASDAAVGVVYDCNVSVDDPEYALAYSEYKSAMDFTMVVVKWDRLEGPDGEKYGRWRDDLLTSLLGVVPAVENTEVIVEERADKPGYFRLSDVYSPKVWGPVLYGTSEGVDSYILNPQIIVDATNETKVFIPAHSTGLNMSPFGVSGMLYMYPYTDRYFSIEPSESLYGTYDKETGTIEFPVDAFMSVVGGNAYNYGNHNEWFRIMLPGFKPIDYSVTLEPGLSAGGEVNIVYTFGSDVSRFRYGVYPGKLNDVQAAEKAQELADDNEAPEVLDPEEGYIAVSGLEKTGVYTIVTANYAKNAADPMEPDEYKDYSIADFTYIASGDQVPVVLTAELNTTDKYASLGYTGENSFEVYLCGKDIQKAYMILDKGDYSQFPGSLLEELLFKSLIENEIIEPLDDDILAEINGEGYLDVTGDLMPGTVYSLMVYAFNGYKWDVITVPAMTAGDYNIIYDSFSYSTNPSYSDITPAESIDELCGTFDYYGVDILKGDKVRKKIGTVTISSPAAGYLIVEGLTGAGAEAAGLESDVLVYTFRNGMINSLPTDYTDDEKNPIVYMQDDKLALPLGIGYVGLNPSDKNVILWALNSYSESLLYAGKVEGADGTEAIAFVDSGIYSRSGYSFSGISLCGFDSPDYNSALKIFSAYDEPLLVPVEAGRRSAAKRTEEASLSMIAKNQFKPAGMTDCTREVKSVEFNSQVSEKAAPVLSALPKTISTKAVNVKSLKMKISE